jgi:hypothetical protein
MHLDEAAIAGGATSAKVLMCAVEGRERDEQQATTRGRALCVTLAIAAAQTPRATPPKGASASGCRWVDQSGAK